MIGGSGLFTHPVRGTGAKFPRSSERRTPIDWLPCGSESKSRSPGRQDSFHGSRAGAAERRFPERSSPRSTRRRRQARRAAFRWDRRSSRRPTARRRPPRWPRRSSETACSSRTTARERISSRGWHRRSSPPTGADLGLFEVDEGAFPDIAGRIRPRAVCLGNLFRDQLDRYGELEHIAERWRTAVADLDPAAWHGRERRRPAARPTSRAGVPRRVSVRARRPVASRRERLPHAADSKYCLHVRGALRLRTPRTSAISATTAARAATTARPPLDVAARAIELDGPRGRRRSTSSRPEATRRVSTLRSRALQRLQRPRRGSRLAIALGLPPRSCEPRRARVLHSRVRAPGGVRGRRPPRVELFLGQEPRRPQPGAVAL